MAYRSVLLAISLAGVTSSTLAQDLPPAKKAAYDEHIARARGAATLGPMTQGMLDNLCAIPVRGRDRPERAPNVAVEPARVFDNLYFVGMNNVSAWAIKTSAGIILIDSLFNPTDAETVIVGGMRKLGLDPAQIKYVVITHGHGDHYGGAQYLADHFGARLLASDIDWNLMQRGEQVGPMPRSPVPRRDLVVADGQKLTLGDTTIELYLTPGHTPGTVSVVLPISQDGKTHRAVLWGGTGFVGNMTAASFADYARSAERFRDIAAREHTDVLISNHSTVDLAMTRLPIVRSRKGGDPNPFVIGEPAVAKALTVLRECALARQVAL